MKMILIYVQDEHDIFNLVYSTHNDTMPDETIHDIARTHARHACTENRWDWTMIRIVKAHVSPSTQELPTLSVTFMIDVEYTLDYSDGEETMELADYIKQVRRDYSDGIGNPFK
jgi:hypothetical protein